MSTARLSIRAALLLYLKGMAIGAADVVPGISGGTIAFITGIYTRLLGALHAVDLFALSLFLRGEWKALWRRIDGYFLALLLAGILTSIFSLAHVVGFLQTHYPVFLRAFFMGLVMASAWYMLRRAGGLKGMAWGWLGLGIALAYGMARMAGWALPSTTLILFLCGILAICAAVLPGISGSFVLLLLGQYAYVMAAVEQTDFITLFVFALGCLVGLLLFSRLVKRLLERYEQHTIALLTGLMIGALYKLWPWQYGVDRLQLQHTSPHRYALLSGDGMQLLPTLGAWCLGMGLVLFFSLKGQEKKHHA